MQGQLAGWACLPIQAGWPDGGLVGLPNLPCRLAGKRPGRPGARAAHADQLGRDLAAAPFPAELGRAGRPTGMAKSCTLSSSALVRRGAIRAEGKAE